MLTTLFSFSHLRASVKNVQIDGAVIVCTTVKSFDYLKKLILFPCIPTAKNCQAPSANVSDI